MTSSGADQHAVVEDRQRIARDLHDLVVQRLFATGMSLRGSLRTADPAATRETVESAVEHLEAAIRDIRSSIFDLEHGARASLRAGVAELAREYADALGFRPTVRTRGPLHALVDRSLARQAIAVLREALANCARHADATSCEVEVSVTDEWLTVRVTDDGRGLPEEVRASGLDNLRARATERGGTLELTAVEPHGLRLRWQVPIARQP